MDAIWITTMIGGSYLAATLGIACGLQGAWSSLAALFKGERPSWGLFLAVLFTATIALWSGLCWLAQGLYGGHLDDIDRNNLVALAGAGVWLVLSFIGFLLGRKT